MKKKDLKNILKPVVEEIIKEMIFQEGALSTLIGECLKFSSSKNEMSIQTKEVFKEEKKINEAKNKLMKSIGSEAYNGVDVFKGTKPLSESRTSSSKLDAPSPLASYAPNDPGVDVNKIFGSEMTNMWKKLSK